MKTEAFIGNLKNSGIYDILDDLKRIALNETTQQSSFINTEDIIKDALLIKRRLDEGNKRMPADGMAIVFLYVLNESGLIKLGHISNRVLLSQWIVVAINMAKKDVGSMIEAYIVTIRRLAKTGRRNDTQVTDVKDSIANIIHELSLVSSFYEEEKEGYEKNIQKQQTKISCLEEQYSELKDKYAALSEEHEQVKKQLDMAQKDLGSAFCKIAKEYMRKTSRKRQSKREEVSDALKDIITQLKLQIPDDVLEQINEFDNNRETTSKTVTNNISGPITNFGTLTGDQKIQ